MTQSAGALLQFFGGLLRGDGSGLGGLFGPGGKRATRGRPGRPVSASPMHSRRLTNSNRWAEMVR